jgi:peptidoglycan/xylan/chitin deacetylase (PgdA/CDA1 family)
MILQVVFILAVSFLVILFAVWRSKYRYPPAGSPQALCYHKITPRFALEGTWTTPGRFEAQIRRLLDSGYEFISEDEFLALLSGAGPNVRKKLLLTFDDGYAELADCALPVIEKHRIPALVFLVAAYAGRENTWDLTLGGRRRRHFSWEETRHLVNAGISIGSHGLTHADLTRLSAERCREELVRSRAMIEEELGIRVRTLSYPFGRCDEGVKKLAEEAGYEAAFSLYPSHPNEVVDRYALRRNGVYVIDSPRTVMRKLEPGIFYWFEEMKCRCINAVSVLTPAIKSLRSRRGTRG